MANATHTNSTAQVRIALIGYALLTLHNAKRTLALAVFHNSPDQDLLAYDVRNAEEAVAFARRLAHSREAGKDGYRLFEDLLSQQENPTINVRREHGSHGVSAMGVYWERWSSQSSSEVMTEAEFDKEVAEFAALKELDWSEMRTGDQRPIFSIVREEQ